MWSFSATYGGIQNISLIDDLTRRIFSTTPLCVERVAEGVSTYVYRIVFQHETFYLRVLPEEGASFAPEVAIHTRLRQLQVKVPEVIYFDYCYEPLQRSVMVTTEIKGIPLSASSDLSQNALEAIAILERIRTYYDFFLDGEQGYLAHGDFDTTHIFQENGKYTGIIDFGEIRGTNCWYDLGHFHMRDGEYSSYSHLPMLIRGYREIMSLPANSEQAIRFTSILINVRALSRSLQKRPANRFTQHQLQVLKEDMAVLSIGISEKR